MSDRGSERSRSRSRERGRVPVRRDSNHPLGNPTEASTSHVSVRGAVQGTNSEETDKVPEADARCTKKVRLKEQEIQPPPDTAMPEIEADTSTLPPFNGVTNTTAEANGSTYLDMVTGKGAEKISIDPWIDEGEVEYEDGDVMIMEKNGQQVVALSEAFRSRLRKPWERAVVVKLMGRAIGFKTLQSKLHTLWQPKGLIKLIDLENNYFAVRLWEEEDYFKALLEGPWTIFTHVLSVQPWTPAFRASSEAVNSVVTWVRFLDFPLDCYHSRILRSMGNLVGKTVKLERNSENPSRGKFAKVAVNVDITKPLKGTVIVEGETYKVIYEGLPDICGGCGRIGHLSTLCPVKVNKDPPANQSTPLTHPVTPPAAPTMGETASTTSSSKNHREEHGVWMNAPRRSRRPLKR
ncbi:hypothetical protein Tsubulata_021995 [Turnera subulata]|uniref:DUF4283 domain-containing protein n=1 Tax=Turnera subulata TaxID=218843 RepID=A0A9Q0J0J2_9ROSI|nr:hypothetical protein Tsubulata_021995 [Turnera subulata]